MKLRFSKLSNCEQLNSGVPLLPGKSGPKGDYSCCSYFIAPFSHKKIPYLTQSN